MLRTMARIPHVGHHADVAIVFGSKWTLIKEALWAVSRHPHYPIFCVVFAEAFDHEVSNLSLAAVESGEVGGQRVAKKDR